LQVTNFEQNDRSAHDIDRSGTSAEEQSLWGGPDEYRVPRESHSRPEPVYSPANSFVRALTEEEIGRLQESLGRPIDRAYLVHWVSQAIRDVVRLSQLPTAREYRDGLLQMSEEGHRWIRQVEACPGISFIPAEVAELKSAVTRFFDQVDLLANKFVVKRGRRTPYALEAFIDRLIGIAKTAKAYPRSEGRAPRSHTAPRNAPDFFCFTTEALKIAADVILSSPLPDNQKGAALLVMVPSKAALSQLIEKSRGRVSDYHESEHGLIERPRTNPRKR
jgi:hypothetical protein